MITHEQIITLSKNVGLNPIIACIGSTKIISDSFGPIVGQLLVEKHKISSPVIGTLLSPLNALNIVERMKTVILQYPCNKIIAVDAYESANNKDSVKIINGGIKPGLATGKNLPRIGDFSIIASTLRYAGNSCCLGRVYSLADKVAKLIAYVVKTAEQISRNSPPSLDQSII